MKLKGSQCCVLLLLLLLIIGLVVYGIYTAANVSGPAPPNKFTTANPMSSISPNNQSVTTTPEPESDPPDNSTTTTIANTITTDEESSDPSTTINPKTTTYTPTTTTEPTTTFEPPNNETVTPEESSSPTTQTTNNTQKPYSTPVATSAPTTTFHPPNNKTTTSIPATPEPSQTSKRLLANSINGLLLLLDLDYKINQILAEESEKNITAFDYLTNINIYYGADDLNGSIYSVSDSSVDLIQYPGELSKTGLAIDFISRKVYVVDSNTEQLVIMDMTGQHVAIVLSDLENPKDIVLDPKRRLMFILQDRSILQANMDGTEIKKIIKNRLMKAMTIDRDAGILYFATKCSLKSIDYVNGNTKLMKTVQDDVQSLTMIKNELFFLVKTYLKNHKILNSCKIVNGHCEDLKANTIDGTIASSLQTIKAYTINFNDVTLKNPCKMSKKHCQHLCVLTPNKNDCRCECSLGWQLSSDLETCEPVNEYLMFAQNNVLRRRMLNFTKTSFVDVYAPHKLNVSPLKLRQPVNFDYISHDNLMVYADDSSLRCVNLVNLTESIIQRSTDCDIIPAVDWVSKNLYFARNYLNGTSHLLVRKINDGSNPKNEKFLLNFGGYVQSLVVHPNIGKIFFSQYVKNDTTYKLHMVDLNGENFVDFSTPTYKTGLAIDFTNDRIYYLSEDAMQIKYLHLSMYDSGKTVINITDIINPTSLGVYKDYIYLSNSTAIWRFNKETGEELKQLAPIFNDYTRMIHNVKVFSKSLQPIADDNPCAVDNGKCDRYCFAVPSVTRKLHVSCGCNDNETLLEDKRTCVRKAELIERILLDNVNRKE